MILKNKVVFVTGGASGLGAASVRAVVRLGAKAVVADVDKDGGDQIVRAINLEYGDETALFVKCDVTNSSEFEESFNSAVKTFKQVDVMVNNAGIVTEINWEKVIEVNLKGVITGTELALAHMRRDKGGHGGIIVNMASYAGYHPFYAFPVYCASKHAVIGYTTSMASAPDVEKLGVRYACICPRKTDTKIVEAVRVTSREEYTADVLALYEKDLMRPDFVADGLLSLIADDDSNNTLLEVADHGLIRKKVEVVDA